MKRTTIAVLGIFALFVLTILLAAAVNAPRVMEAEAHRQAAAAMQTQAAVTGLAVGGMLLLVGVLSAGVLGLTGLLIWAAMTGRLSMAGRFNTGTLKSTSSGRGRRQPTMEPALPYLVGLDAYGEHKAGITWVGLESDVWSGERHFAR